MPGDPSNIDLSRRAIRRWKTTLAIGFFVVFALVAKFRGEISRALSVRSETGRVAYVYDGDTVRLADGRHVRYIGIDTPEMDAATDRVRRLAEAAREANVKLVDGREVRLVFDVERADKYGRTLAYVYAGDLFVNARLVADGWARAEFYGDNSRFRAEFDRLESEARSKRLGIWAGGSSE